MKQCPKCSASHEKTGKFCSRKCANSRSFSDATNAKRAESNRKTSLSYWQDKRNTSICPQCGTIFTSAREKKFCGVGCRREFKLTANHTTIKNAIKETPIQYTKRLIESGELHSLAEPVIRKHMKRYLVHVHGHVCIICGISEWMGVIT